MGLGQIESVWCRTLTAAMGLVVVSGCSLMLSWEEDKLPCSADRACLAGYSCLGMECVADGSLVVGDTCMRDGQCGGDNVTCGRDPSTCRRKCTSYFEPTLDCVGGEYCRPEVDPQDSQGWVGTCMSSQCQRHEDCENGRVCVKINAAAGACLDACSVRFFDGGEGSVIIDDTCDSVPGSLKSCQPLDAAGGEKVLVCRPILVGTGETVGSFCDVVESPCEAIAACVEGLCYRYCDAEDAPCDSPRICMPVQSLGVTVFSVCMMP